jgi:serine/threonine-protein kinase
MSGEPVAPGRVLAGKYRIDRVLGQGAMGVVVAATNLDLEQSVAIKLMIGGHGAGEHEARFMREARAAARLRSEHVGRVFDVGRLEGGAPYIVMELLDGQDLAALLRARGPLPVHEAVDYVLQACVGVAEAHAAGIVHRDLKPANLFLTRGADKLPVVKVVDFGISKLDAGGVALTQTREMLGSPLYMSPEQIRASSSVDARSDVWALGVVLYELVAGRTPFHAEEIMTLCTRVGFEPPKPLATYLRDAPPNLEAVVFQCLEKDRERRFPDIATFAAALVPFGSAPRAALHAERAAGILSTEVEASRPTAVLAPESTGQVASATAGPVVTLNRPLRPRWSARSVIAATVGIAVGLAALGLVLMRAAGGPAPASSHTTAPSPSASTPPMVSVVPPAEREPPPTTPSALAPSSSATTTPVPVPSAIVPASAPLGRPTGASSSRPPSGKVAGAASVKSPPSRPNTSFYDQ